MSKEQQFQDWVRDYSDMLFSHAIQRGFDHDSAKDLVQETYLSAWRGMDEFQGKASVKNWLFVILRNKITDQYRKHSMQVTVILEGNDEQFDVAGHWTTGAYPKELTINPFDSGDAVDFNQILSGCSGKLNEIQKAVFFMKYMDELESDDICIQLSITPNNYWTILHRAKVQLRACLERNWFLTKSR